jgi:hypothetical protein
MGRRTTAAGVLLAAVLAAGCQRTLVDKTVTLESGDIKASILEATSRSQTVNVEVSSAKPIDVWVVLEKDRPEVERKLQRQKAPDPAKVIASERGKSSATVTATIPADQESAVILSGAMLKTDVKLKITVR